MSRTAAISFLNDAPPPMIVSRRGNDPGARRMVVRVSSTDSRKVASASSRIASSGRPSTAERAEDFRKVIRRAEGKRTVRGEKPRRLGRMRQQVGDRARIDRWLQPRQTLAAHRRQRERLDGLDDAIEFEALEGAWLHKVIRKARPRPNEAGTANTIADRGWGLGAGDWDRGVESGTNSPPCPVPGPQPLIPTSDLSD